jgi:hypothetical protein
MGCPHRCEQRSSAVERLPPRQPQRQSPRYPGRRRHLCRSGGAVPTGSHVGTLRRLVFSGCSELHVAPAAARRCESTLDSSNLAGVDAGFALVDQVGREDRTDLQDRARACRDRRGLVLQQPPVETEQVIGGPLPPRTLLPQIDDAASLLGSLHRGAVRHDFSTLFRHLFATRTKRLERRNLREKLRAFSDRLSVQIRTSLACPGVRVESGRRSPWRWSPAANMRM